MDIAYLKEEEIEQKVDIILDKAFKMGIYNKNEATPLVLIIEHILGYQIIYEELEKHQIGAIGMIDCASKVIWLDQSLDYEKGNLSDEGRHNFTLGHEIGHFALHYNLSQSENMELLYHENNSSQKRIEIQANLFASMLTMPRSLMIKKWDHDFCSCLDFEQKIYKMTSFFRVSRQALKYRLDNLGLSS